MGIYIESTYKDLVKKILKNSPFINNIISKYDFLWGPFTETMPDIFVIPRDDVILRSEKYRDSIYTKTYLSSHSIDAFISLYGDNANFNIVNKPRQRKIKLYDIAPTVMHLLKVPIPNDTDGNVIIRTTEPKTVQNYKIKFIIARRVKLII